VSVDLVVWEGPQPAGDSEARAAFDELSARFLDAPRSPPTQAVADYVSVLVGRYPDLSEDDDVRVPWGSGPLIKNASGPLVYIDMKLNSVFQEGWRYSVDTARSHGLVAFDPQSGRLADSDPTAAPTPSPPGARRGGPVYRWVSLRSWRWPFLRPLLPVLRRFL
jgi:hypothetical protein